MEQKSVEKQAEYVLVIHGGAGNIIKEKMNPEKETKYVEKLTEVLEKGAKILQNGGSSLDAVEVSIRIMEDSPLFNSGKGAVFNADGKNELDASIMDGKTLNAGAVANVTIIKNPISAARKVMTDSEHVLLIKEGAEEFAKQQGLEIVEPEYFFDQNRWNSLQKIKNREANEKPSPDEKHGTCGAVALDKFGNLAAGTSTGGMTNKKFGRVGDSPIIGAGTYANNKTCAVSSTGHGEFFIRNVVAYDISALMEYKNMTLSNAANYVIKEKLNANGGIIAVDKDGNIAMPFNTSGMFRGFINSKGEFEVKLYGN
ncbi:MAG: isoaspartyl peptidase/L-asparaginase [Bacteroidales bacterium]|nr:isoaspartyl peptidase/L-asparaginase [Bacteroidales bacterium]